MILIAGPCVLENVQLAVDIAGYLKELTDELGIDYVFKGSFDKANRSAVDSFRGPGIYDGVDILEVVKRQVGVRVTTDVHEVQQTYNVGIADCVDILQIPAFLCRQTDLLLAAAKTGKIVNVKKGQFLNPDDIGYIWGKVNSVGCKELWITERGSCFGYDLVVDFRLFPSMKKWGKVIFDATHTAKQRIFVPRLARAACGVGVDGLFMEVYPEPEKALCDGAVSVALKDVKPILEDCLNINAVNKKER
jgi:2-dehydro-3-deoxyphosphooctonate aldolase (KDO 8-P synthase)